MTTPKTTGEKIYMRQSKASMEEWEALVDWFNKREDEGKECPDWRRVVFGYEVLLKHCCDPKKDYLDWNPKLKKLMERK